jgi:hypothetical protein
MPANHVDNKEKMLIKVATQGGNDLLFIDCSAFYYLILHVSNVKLV